MGVPPAAAGTVCRLCSSVRESHAAPAAAVYRVRELGVRPRRPRLVGRVQVGVATAARHDLAASRRSRLSCRRAARRTRPSGPPSNHRLAESADRTGPAPLAVLRIPKDSTRGGGAARHRRPDARPRRRSHRGHGATGNGRELGHRRATGTASSAGLKDIAEATPIELDTLQGKDVYRVERTWVVDPEDVSVLDPTPTRALTLVTCYPFYFVGSAPAAVHRPCRAASGDTTG